MGIVKKIISVAILIVIVYGVFNVVSTYDDSPFRPESGSNVPQNDVLTSLAELRTPLCYEDDCDETSVPMISRKDPTGETMWIETDRHYQQRLIENIFLVLIFPAIIIGMAILIIYKIISNRKKEYSKK